MIKSKYAVDKENENSIGCDEIELKSILLFQTNGMTLTWFII